MEQNEATNVETKNADAGEDLSWDDVQEELKATSKTDISVASFDEISRTEKKGQTALDIDFILDIPLTLTVELGRSRMLISDLLQLGQGSVVELSKIAGEPMEVYVNQRLIARGEVVVVNEKFGVRLTDIISPAERINKLK
jgi:flagellar motor switch protein FliN/FliY